MKRVGEKAVGGIDRQIGDGVGPLRAQAAGSWTFGLIAEVFDSAQDARRVRPHLRHPAVEDVGNRLKRETQHAWPLRGSSSASSLNVQGKPPKRSCQDLVNGTAAK